MRYRATTPIVSACLLWALASPGLAAQDAPDPGAAAVAATLAANEDTKSSAESDEPDWEDEPYIIKNGKVDFGVYNGYRRYANSCHRCHGPDGSGSSYAPSLVKSLETMSYPTFLDKVVNGVEKVDTSNTQVMPAFAEAKDVMQYIDHIYAYLKARSNGDVGRGRPDRLPPEQDPVFKEYKESQ